MTGDTFLSHRAKRIAKAIRKEATVPSMFKADMELALAVLETVPVGVFVVGDPRDPHTQRLRQDAFMAFEPLKVIVNLDPQQDRERLTSLELPGTAGVSVGLFAPGTSYITPQVEGRGGIEDACSKVRSQL